MLQNCLKAEDEDAPVQDPFQALKTAEVLAESIASILPDQVSRNRVFDSLDIDDSAER